MNNSMKQQMIHLRSITMALVVGCTVSILAQPATNPPQRPVNAQPPGGGFPPPQGGPDFNGPPPFGPGGFDGPGGFGGPGGPGGFGPMQQSVAVLTKFDKDGNGWLNKEERKAAREYLNSQQSSQGSGRRGGPRGGFGGPGGNQDPTAPGIKMTPADVKNYPKAPMYDMGILRTFFLEFDNEDWEKELAIFKNTDVEVPMKLTVDGVTYTNVGVHYRGNTSYMMVPDGRKRPLNLSLDCIQKKQQLGGYRTFELLNSADDPTFMHTALFCMIARDYIPASKVNHVRVVINGENWGIYVNAQQYNKDLINDCFGTTKGARWKVPGSPGGRGGFAYLGEDVEAYKRIYEIKTKDDPKVWADLIKFCKVLNETPSEKLEAAVTPLLNVDEVLKFMALDNLFANGDGFWTRASDYNIYQDVEGRFNLIPHDVNETFSTGGGPGGPGGFGGPGGPGGFGPGMMIAPQMLSQADSNKDQKLTSDEFVKLADTWFDKLDADETGKLNQEQFIAKLADVLPAPQGFGPQGGGMPGGQRGGGRGGFNPASLMGSGLFTVLDVNKDATVTRVELKETFGKWYVQWDTEKKSALDEQAISNGLTAVLPRPEFGGRGQRGGGPGGGRGPGGFGGPGGPGGGGVELDPLVAANNQNNPLISKLLAVPSFRTRYLTHIRDIANKWLDWNKLGAVVQQVQSLIVEDVKKDTKKLFTTEAFLAGVSEETPTGTGRQASSIKSFAEKRRAFILNHAEIKKLPR